MRSVNNNQHPTVAQYKNDKTSVASPEQKLLDLKLQNEKDKNAEKKNKNQTLKKEKKLSSEEKKEAIKSEIKTEKDPMKLLKAI